VRLLFALAFLAAADGGPAISSRTLSRPVKIEADDLSDFSLKQRAEWVGRVRITADTTKIRCDRLAVTYTEGHEIKRLFCDGNVEAIDQDKRVHGEHADFDNERGIVIVEPQIPQVTAARLDAGTPDAGTPRAGSGRVEIWDGETHLWGRRATFRVGESKLEVDHPTTLLGPEHRIGSSAKAKDAG